MIWHLFECSREQAFGVQWAVQTCGGFGRAQSQGRLVERTFCQRKQPLIYAQAKLVVLHGARLRAQRTQRPQLVR